MRVTSKAQSLVEMAFIGPLLISIFFLIVDAGFWIYGYGTIYNAARRASEQAAKSPPYTTKLSPMDMGDLCVAAIVGKADDNALFFLGTENDIRNGRIIVSYPSRALTPGGTVLSKNDPGLRLVGGQIEVSITGEARFLTPLPRLVGLSDRFTVNATSRRTIESLGLNPAELDGISCDP